MPFTASYSTHEDCLVAEIKGSWALEDGLALTDSIRGELNKHGLDKVLIDFQGVEGPYSVTDRYQIGMYLTKQFTHETKLAVVVRADVNTRLTENVVVNRGGRLRIAMNREEAFQWLCEGDTPTGNHG